MQVRKAASGISSIAPVRSMPALFTNTSTGPCASIRPNACFTLSSESTSIVSIRMGSFSLAACSPSSGEPVGLRIVATTRCPARANSTAVAKPIPRLAPVITILNIVNYRVDRQPALLPWYQPYERRRRSNGHRIKQEKQALLAGRFGVVADWNELVLVHVFH